MLKIGSQVQLRKDDGAWSSESYTVTGLRRGGVEIASINGVFNRCDVRKTSAPLTALSRAINRAIANGATPIVEIRE